MAFGYGLTWGPGSPGVPTAPGGVDPTLMPKQPVVGGPFGVNPDYPNPLATSRETVTGNIGNLGDLYKLGTGITDITNVEAASGLNANLPNYQALTTTASGDILSNLQGDIPADVWRNIEQAGAERGVATGSPGSPNANAADSTTNSTDEWIAALLAGAGGKPGFSFNPPGSQGGGPQSPFGDQYGPDAEYLKSIGDEPVVTPPPSSGDEEDYYFGG